MVSFDGLVRWSRLMVRWSRSMVRWTQQNERGYLYEWGLYTTLALRLSKAGAPLASSCCPCSDLRLPASAYQDACMKISSPFPSALTAVSGQAHLIDRFPACGSGSLATRISMYPCRCTDLEALQLLQRLQLASWNCARVAFRVYGLDREPAPAATGLLVGLYKFVGDPEFEMPQSARPLERH